MRIIVYVLTCIAIMGCENPKRLSLQTFRPSFGLTVEEVANIEGIMRVPEDMPIWVLANKDTMIQFHGADWGSGEIVWQVWEFPIDSTGPDYVHDFLFAKGIVIGCLYVEPLRFQTQCFHAKDVETNLYYECSLNAGFDVNTLSIRFEFPKLAD